MCTCVPPALKKRKDVPSFKENREKKNNILCVGHLVFYSYAAKEKKQLHLARMP